MTASSIATCTKNMNLLSSRPWPWSGTADAGALMALDVLEQVDGREDHDPDDVDEVPVEAHHLDVDRLLLRQPARERVEEHAGEPDDADQHVEAVRPRQREERRAEDAVRDRQVLLVDEVPELEHLAAEEDAAE